MTDIPLRTDRPSPTRTRDKLVALALAIPVAWLVYVGLLAIRGPAEFFEEEDPLPAPQVAVFQDVAAISAWPHPADWPMLGHNPHHTGRSPVEFASADLVAAWDEPFVGDRTHVWNVEKGACVWSPPAVGRIPFPDGSTTPMLFVGCYDRSLYALDARTGKRKWRHGFTEGGVFTSPALAMVAGRPMVFAAATDRVVYALDARTGAKVWAYETFKWTQSVTRAQMSSPTPVVVHGKTLLLVGVWNSDTSGLANVQLGELLAFDAATGAVEWSVRLGTSPVTSPAVAAVRGGLLVFAAGEDGTLRALDARSGRIVWHRTLHQELRSSPALGVTEDGVPTVVIGTRMHTAYGIGAAAGRKLWMYQTGNWVDSTPAIVETDAGTRALVGSYDYQLYSLDLAAKGRQHAGVWRFKGPNEFRSNAAVATVAGRPAAFAICFDDTLHLFDAANGQPLWKHQAGPLLFSHEFQGDSLWSSPAAADFGDGARVFFPANDGKLYAFKSKR